MNFFLQSQIEVPAWVLNPWVLVCYGWVGYNIYVLMKNRKEYDKDKSGYLSAGELAFYFRVNSLAILFSIWTIPAGVYFADDIWAMFISIIPYDWEFSLFAYVVMGGLSALIQFIVKKVTESR